MRSLMTASLALAMVSSPLCAQWTNDPYARDPSGGDRYGSGYYDRDGWRDSRNGGFGDLRRGMSLVGRGELKVESRGRMPVSRIFVRQSNRGDLTLAIDSYRGRDQVARAVVRKWRDDKIEAELVSFNGAPARGKLKIEFDGRRGYFEKAEISGKVYNDDIRLKFRH